LTVHRLGYEQSHTPVPTHSLRLCYRLLLTRRHQRQFILHSPCSVMHYLPIALLFNFAASCTSYNR